MSRQRGFWFKIIISSIAVFIIIVYAIFNSRLLLSGPNIDIYEPLDGSVFEEKITSIRGRAQNISFISLNGFPIFVDEEGNFKEKLLLSSGTSIIEFYARDKFGRETIKILNLTHVGTRTSPTINIVEETEVEEIEEDSSEISE